MKAEDQTDTAKAALRRRMKQLRAAIPEPHRSSFSQSIAARLFEIEQVRSAQSFFVFISYADEVQTHDIIRRLLAEGRTVSVPKIMGRHRMEAVQFSSWEQLEHDSLGILAPVADGPAATEVDVCITPGLAFTVAGHRLGYGRGYYDHWFAAHRAGLKVALAFEAQVIDDVPVGEYDVTLDMILTERRRIVVTADA